MLRVGEQRAEEIKNRAATRGTALHKLCENYILGKPSEKVMPFDQILFSQIKPVLDSRVGKILGYEVPVYCNFLKVAGRLDLFAEFDNIESIVDYKSSTRIKREEDILSYFLQETIYAICLEEMLKKPIKQIVTIIAVEHELEPQIFIKRRKEFDERVVEVVKQYYRSI